MADRAAGGPILLCQRVCRGAMTALPARTLAHHSGLSIEDIKSLEFDSPQSAAPKVYAQSFVRRVGCHLGRPAYAFKEFFVTAKIVRRDLHTERICRLSREASFAVSHIICRFLTRANAGSQVDR
jgi:hypothetical protein